MPCTIRDVQLVQVTALKNAFEIVQYIACGTCSCFSERTNLNVLFLLIYSDQNILAQITRIILNCTSFIKYQIRLFDDET